MKTKTLAGFEIYISVPLNIQELKDGNAELCRLTHDTHVEMYVRK